MAISSMTGFGRAEGAESGFDWAWEVRAVNGRGLDLRFRLPPGFDSVEPALRRLAQDRLRRGNVSATLTLGRAEALGAVRINRAVLDEVLAVIDALSHVRDAPPPRLETVLGLRGVIEAGEEEPTEEERARLVAAVSEGFGRALDALAAARREEGARTAAALAGHLDEIAALNADAGACAAAQPDSIRDRLARQIAELLGPDSPVPAERLAQEAALLATRADVREELDRLAAHVEAGRALLADGGTVGRKLDFLAQEFNREANTLCSKSADTELTRIGLALKAAIDRLREQVQNIE